MRVTSYELVLFLMCLNLSGYLLNQSGMLPYYTEAQPTTPTEYVSNLNPTWQTITYITLAGAGAVFSVAIFGFGGLMVAVIWVIMMFAPFVNNFFLSVPEFISHMGIPSYVTDVFYAIFIFVHLLFFLGILSQRREMTGG